MNFSKIFLFVVLATLLLAVGQTEAGWLKKLGKKVEKAGQRVFNAAEKALPVATGIKALGK
ncbi:cecropin-A-like [Anopheles cruzii]|uniref:cecropin-A-like n=1 Tax=Anopheles cruzii TaxID=68878 RepID=UPI0022EC2BE0|nr:cecropin-A-like [Anopheles cruzii]